jgi:hypothetical protein
MNSPLNTIGATNISNSERQDLDFYQTPTYATKTLANRFDFKTKLILEPAAGNGMISKELKNLGFNVYSTDIIERNFVLNDIVDYFTIDKIDVLGNDFSIVTNPPYECLDKFILHTLTVIKPKTCCFFLPVRSLEGQKRYNLIYSKFKPCKIYLYVKRLGCFTEKDLIEGKVTKYGIKSAVAYMWLCFDRETWLDSNTKTELEWII